MVRTKEGNRLQIIGVLDLRGGRAVHARAGARDRYSAVQNAAGWPIDPGNARTLAEIYTDVLGVSDIYAADLDAILERRPQEEVTKDLASMSAPLWLDAGVRSVDDARRAIELGASRVIVGLETLPSFEVLSNICTALGKRAVSSSASTCAMANRWSPTECSFRVRCRQRASRRPRRVRELAR